VWASDNLYRPDHAECPNRRKLLAKVRTLRRDLAAAKNDLASAKQRIQALEAELRRGKRQAAPFSRDTTKARPKRPGRKKGQGPFNHRPPPPEAQITTVTTPLERCPVCGGPLRQRRTHAHLQTDIPRPAPVHTRFVTESGYCPRCKQRFRSRHPDQSSTAAGAAGVPYAKIADFLHATAGLEVAPGALCQSSQRLADRLQPAYGGLARRSGKVTIPSRWVGRPTALCPATVERELR